MNIQYNKYTYRSLSFAKELNASGWIYVITLCERSLKYMKMKRTVLSMYHGLLRSLIFAEVRKMVNTLIQAQKKRDLLLLLYKMTAFQQ